jgi:hypothetical protein
MLAETAETIMPAALDSAVSIYTLRLDRAIHGCLLLSTGRLQQAADRPHAHFTSTAARTSSETVDTDTARKHACEMVARGGTTRSLIADAPIIIRADVSAHRSVSFTDTSY